MNIFCLGGTFPGVANVCDHPYITSQTFLLLPKQFRQPEVAAKEADEVGKKKTWKQPKTR